MKKDFQLNQSKENPSRWKPGEKVQHFTILNYIASEPLGDNYLAKDSQLNRIVAIKRFSFNVDMKYSVELVKKLQAEWSDNAVSVTIYYRKEELPSIQLWLKHNYNDNLKTVSFL